MKAGAGPTRLSGQHAADERPPSDGTDDAVHSYGRHVKRERLLESPRRFLRPRPEDPVHLKPPARVARQVAELELLLHTVQRVAAAALPDGDDQGRPGSPAD